MVSRLLAQSITDHDLVLVCDPDGILEDEALLASLAAQDCTVIRARDPVVLRREVQRAWAHAAPRIVVITPHALNTLPYDLWQQGQHVTLALSGLFPHLDYPTVRALHPGQRRKLDRAYAVHRPARTLSPLETQDFLLRVVFEAAPERLAAPAALLLWLDDHHRQPEPLPQDLQARLAARLSQVPAYATWPLPAVLFDAGTYRAFVRDEWQQAVGHLLGDARVEYTVLPFAADEDLQDALPRLVRTGTLAPVIVDEAGRLPGWAVPAVALDSLASHRRRLEAAAADVQQQLAAAGLRWEDWQRLARRWAELTLLRYDYDFSPTSAQSERLAELETALDAQFVTWLHRHYSALAGSVLPTPHHLFHVAEFMSYARGTDRRPALLVLDGMSLADWLLIRRTWLPRHPDWEVDERLVLAQVPAITAVSRQALVSGRRPAAFAETITSSREEAQHWANLQQRRFGSAAGAVYQLLPDRAGAPYPPALDSQYTQSLCLVSPVIDAMVHGATQGTADVSASLKLWLADGFRTSTGSSWFEGLIDRLLLDHYVVTIATDHGHVEALGMGQPQEGVTVETRSTRARLYNNHDFACAVQANFPDTILWTDDGLLPAGWQALLPAGRRAFAPLGQRVVSHGGLTIDEMVVPVITIDRGQSGRHGRQP
jgi:hypothetical protein